MIVEGFDEASRRPDLSCRGRLQQRAFSACVEMATGCGPKREPEIQESKKPNRACSQTEDERFVLDRFPGLPIRCQDMMLLSSCVDTRTCRIDGSSTFSVLAGSGRGRERSSGPRLLSHIMSLGDGSRDGAWIATADMLGGVVGASFNWGWGGS